MARDPGSVWAPLPEAGAPDGRTKNKFIVHSTGDNGTAAATRNYFAGPTLNESTFIVGWGPQDPTLQIMDSSDIADANGDANDEGISIEVVGDGKSGFNAWQRSELIRLGIWARANHPQILPQIIPSAAQASAGFGWHIMFGAPGPWAKAAKICPGPVRIEELKRDIFPAIFTGNTSRGFLMALNDQQQAEVYNDLKAIRRDLGLLPIPIWNDRGAVGEKTARQVLGEIHAAVTGGGPAVSAGSFAGLSQADLDAVAEAVNDEKDRRERDGDPATGPTS